MQAVQVDNDQWMTSYTGPEDPFTLMTEITVFPINLIGTKILLMLMNDETPSNYLMNTPILVLE